MLAMDDPYLVVEAIVKACTDPKEETPVGIKAKMSDISHHLFGELTERMTAALSKNQTQKGTEVSDTTGTLFTPMEEGRTVDGGIRERMKQEDN